MKKIIFFVLVGVCIGLSALFCRTTVIDRCAAGLILNMIGVLIVFVFGFPQPDYDAGCSIGLEGGTVIDDKGTAVDDKVKQDQINKKWHKALSILGLVYLFVGFAFQLWYQLAQSLK
jgi:hypothetical protein